MFRAAKILKVNIMLMQKDLLEAIRYLGNCGLVQLIEPEQPDTDVFKQERRTNEKQMKRLQDLALSLNVTLPRNAGSSTPITVKNEDEQQLLRLEEQLHPLATELQELKDALSEKKSALDELHSFQSLNFDFKLLNEVSFLHFQFGSVPTRRLDELRSAAGNRIIIQTFPESDAGQNRTALLAITSRKGRFAQESLLQNHAFNQIRLPAELEGIPARVSQSLQQDINSLQERCDTISAQIDLLSKQYRSLLIDLFTTRLLLEQLYRTAGFFQHTGYTSSIDCWVSAAQLDKLTAGLEQITSAKVVVESEDPRRWSLKERRDKKVPVLLKNNWLLRPFESLIANFGYPEYGEIEPTPLVAIGFLLMFGIMFGDVGQGGVLVLAGLVLALRKGSSVQLRLAGRLVASAGLSGIFFGFVYGSVFSNPHLIHPLWKEPLADPSNIMTLFAATVVFGIIWINMGLLLNLINQFRFHNWKHALLEKTGVTGIFFYWAALLTVLSKAVLDLPISFDLLLAAMIIPLIVIFFKEPLANLFSGKPLFEHGVLTFIMEGVVELIDTLSYFLGNTVSFVRVGAFALAHSGLSMAVMELHKLVGGGLAGIIVVILGNALIILLEGMVVTIQTLRLEYYEFFSKFYSGSGRPFTPFSLQ